MQKPSKTDCRIYANRNRLACGVDGGMPLNMTLHAICRTRDLAVALLPQGPFAAIAVGMGDALVPALFAAVPHCVEVGGVELFVHGDESWGERFHCAKMLREARETPIPTSFLWDTDVLALKEAAQLAPHTSAPLVAYGFDDSIPEAARRHWYWLLEQEPRACVVCTTAQSRLNLQLLLPSFAERARFKVGLEGGNCSRTMVLLQRTHH
jgi:hypothetical protein